MRLMIRWSPISSVFSIEPEGITRACPIVPLISMNANATQNHAMISRSTRWPTGRRFSSFSFSLFVASAFTFHRHRALGRWVFYATTVRSIPEHIVGGRFAYLELHEVGRVHSSVARGAEAALGIVHRLFQTGQRDVAE